MTIIDLEELKAKLDKVPCKPRLYPARLFALQLLTGKKLDELIDIKIVQPLSKVTEFQGSQIQYRFTPETLKPTRAHIPPTLVHQFIRDFAVFGLREAILYFHTYEFLSDPSELIDNAISVYRDIAKSYLDNVDKLETSQEKTIRNMILAMKLYGEGVPQDVKERYVPRMRARGECEFKDICKRMGGEYETETGLLEPDVGHGHWSELSGWQAKKEWCTFKKMLGLRDGMLVVFQGTAIGAERPETMSVKVYDKDGYDLLDSNIDGDFKTEFRLDEQTMVFKSKNKAIMIRTSPSVKYGKKPNGIEFVVEPRKEFDARAR